MRAPKIILALVAAALLAPSAAFAQKASLTGIVRDTSGAILPGVTVEASSPVLIEKVRAAVSDGSGQYRIIDLDPGTYQVTFALPGFTKVVREGVQISGTAVVTINAEMRVGALEETITVTGETPVVDVQSSRRETVIGSDVIAAIPATRTVGSLLNATPGLTVDNNGVQPTPTMTFFSARGGQTNEGRMTINGMTTAAAFNGGGVSSYILDTVNVDEVSVTVSGGLGESDIGAPTMNLVPKQGGNRFSGQAFINSAGDWSRGNNLDDDLRAVGIRETPGIIKSYDTSFTYSGPIKRDRLWFLGSYRRLNTATAVEGIVGNANAYNLNASDPNSWLYRRDDSITARQMQGREMFIGRATAQIGSKHRIAFSHEYQLRCEGSPLKVETDGCHTRGANWVAAGSAVTSPEASTNYFDFPYYQTQVLWTAPLTDRVLLDAGYSRLAYYHAGGPGQLPPDGIHNISVTEQSTAINPATGQPWVPRANYTYRALAGYSDNYGNPNTWRASASYVTGAHNAKIGYQGSYLVANSHFIRNPTLLSYAFNQGQPVSFTMNIPDWRQQDRTKIAAFYAQDSWTRGRLTLQGALRYDRAWSYSPAENNGTTATSRVNAQPISLPLTASVDAYNDITPRFGAAYDLFGNGKTAIKFNMGHYLDAATNDGSYTRNSPAQQIVRTVTRNWSDTNGNRIVDCDLLNFSAQTSPDSCAALGGNNLNFGKNSALTTQVNPEMLHGWGVRASDWQWGINVQHQLIPRVSLEVGYNRRWWNGPGGAGWENGVTDNINRSPSDYQEWVITAPSDPRLPGGGGYPIRMFTITSAANSIPAQNHITFETDFGPKRINYWHGVDTTVNARFRNGLFLQIGTSTGREIEDYCATEARIGHGAGEAPDVRNCRVVDPFLTTLRGLGSYTIPKIDVMLSATFRSQPPLEIGFAGLGAATWNVPNALVQQLLGRLPPSALPTGTTPVLLLDADHRLFYGGRRNQIDVRVAKILRFGPTRADIGIDIQNITNTNYATGYISTYQYSANNVASGGTFLNPTAVYTPRFVRVNATFNF
jgi:carboxypeptidase family protein/TonB-dependent receptor-like protein